MVSRKVIPPGLAKRTAPISPFNLKCKVNTTAPTSIGDGVETCFRCRKVLILDMLEIMFIIWALGAAGLFCFVLYSSEVGAFKNVSMIGFAGACLAWPLMILGLVFSCCTLE